MDQQTRMDGVLAGHRKIIRGVLTRITLYYIAMAAIAAITISIFRVSSTTFRLAAWVISRIMERRMFATSKTLS